MSAPYYQDDHVSLFVGDWRELIAPDLRADLISRTRPWVAAVTPTPPMARDMGLIIRDALEAAA